MIAANELRKGNYIKSKLLGTNHQVTGLLPNGDIYTSLQSAYSELIDWEPIPLTPAILVDNCGFEKRKGRFIGNQFTIGINQRTEDYMMCLQQVDETKDEFFFQNSGHPVKYLHQLQNGFHFLTSSELEVKF